MSKCGLDLLLDLLLEDADVLGVLNLDGKDRIHVVAKHPTVELEGARHASASELERPGDQPERNAKQGNMLTIHNL